ncbi:MAG: ThuA domain-containing protein [Verrucomicrobiota bacterium]
MNTTRAKLVIILAALILPGLTLHAAGQLKALIVDGQNNHDWKNTTPVLRWILEQSGRFTVSVSTTTPAGPREPKAPKGPLTPEQKAARESALAKWRAESAEAASATAKLWGEWRPAFGDYDVIVCNYNGQLWPEQVRADFVRYVRDGGGLVVVHAADNGFADWPEYNEMIGVGGWGGRDEKSGPMVRWRDGKIVLDNSPGPGGGHGSQHEFVIDIREPEHPITKGLPLRWKHAADELYSKLRGPSKNLTVLATAFAAPETHGTGEHEPILMTVTYGKGRVFHTVLGHGPQAMAGLGFQVTLARGAEWAATGTVTLSPPKPEDLPSDKAALRSPGENRLPAGLAAQTKALEPLRLQLPGPTMKGTPSSLPSGPNLEPLSDKPRPAFMVPKGVQNVALGRPVTSSVNPFSGELPQVTDGKKEPSDEDAIEFKKGLQWVQVDLGQSYALCAIAMWHDHRYVQVMHDVIVQVSDDPEFKTAVTTVFNNDSDNSSKLGVGTDREYFETNQGRIIDAKGVRARYVRGYTNGTTLTALNCWQELEVYALAAK